MKQSFFNITYELSVPEVHRGIDRALAEGTPTYICVADGNILTMVHNDLEYRKVVNGAMFSICDSSWVPVYIDRLYGFRPQQYCGSQIFEDLIGMRKYRMMFMGGSPDVLGGLREKLSQTDSRIADMPFVELPFRSVDDFDYEAIAAQVNAYGPDVVWVALGAPKQEIFASRLAPLLGRGVVIPVGAVFNFYSGVGVKRAPGWMVKCHLEFLYRIFSEPRKQLRRCWLILKTLPRAYREEKGKSR